MEPGPAQAEIVYVVLYRLALFPSEITVTVLIVLYLLYSMCWGLAGLAGLEGLVGLLLGSCQQDPPHIDVDIYT